MLYMDIGSELPYPGIKLFILMVISDKLLVLTNNFQKLIKELKSVLVSARLFKTVICINGLKE